MDSTPAVAAVDNSSARRSNLYSVRDPAVDSVLVQLVKILARKSDKQAELETRNALHLIVPHLATERRSARLLTSFRSARDLEAVIVSTDWRPALRRWKSKRVMAVAS